MVSRPSAVKFRPHFADKIQKLAQLERSNAGAKLFLKDVVGIAATSAGSVAVVASKVFMRMFIRSPGRLNFTAERFSEPGAASETADSAFLDTDSVASKPLATYMEVSQHMEV